MRNDKNGTSVTYESAIKFKQGYPLTSICLT